MSNLGRKIRELRKAANLTLDELAEKSGSSKSYIWELENRPATRPSAEKLARVAEVLGTTLEFLLDDRDQVTAEDARDKAFYREYREQDAATKAKIRETLKLWGRDGE